LPETPNRQPAMPGAADVLSDVLRVVHLSGAIFFHADIAAPWAARTVSAPELARVLLPHAGQFLRRRISRAMGLPIGRRLPAPVEYRPDAAV
jgi:Cupin